MSNYKDVGHHKEIHVSEFQDDITPSDTTIFPTAYRSLYIGGEGDVSYVEGGWREGEGRVSYSGTALYGFGTNFSGYLAAGDLVLIKNQPRIISSITNNTAAVVTAAFDDVDLTERGWSYAKEHVAVGLTAGSTLNVAVRMVRVSGTDATYILGLK